MCTQNNSLSFTIQPQQELLSYQYRKKHGILLKTKKEIEAIRKSCRLAATILSKTCAQVKVGITTNELNDYAHSLMLEANAIPAPLGYGTPPFLKAFVLPLTMLYVTESLMIFLCNKVIFLTLMSPVI